MKYKLWILNLVLAGAALWAGVEFRNSMKDTKAREAEVLNKSVRVAPPPPFEKLPQQPPVTAMGYAPIAQQTLFDRSRNPNVVVEVPPPPPPKPVPPLPVYHGQMNLGGGPLVILSANKDSEHKSLHIGETIGQFKLKDVNTEEMVLEWEGGEVHKRLDELTNLTASAGQAAEATAARTDAPAAPAAPPPPVKSGPGEMTQFGFKTCAVNDGQAEGAVVDGFKKVMHVSPFGQSCTWEPVGK